MMIYPAARVHSIVRVASPPKLSRGITRRRRTWVGHRPLNWDRPPHYRTPMEEVMARTPLARRRLRDQWFSRFRKEVTHNVQGLAESIRDGVVVRMSQHEYDRKKRVRGSYRWVPEGYKVVRVPGAYETAGNIAGSLFGWAGGEKLGRVVGSRVPRLRWLGRAGLVTGLAGSMAAGSALGRIGRAIDKWRERLMRRRKLRRIRRQELSDRVRNVMLSSHWDDQPRIPKGMPGGGRWVSRYGSLSSIPIEDVIGGSPSPPRERTYVRPPGTIEERVEKAIEMKGRLSRAIQERPIDTSLALLSAGLLTGAAAGAGAAMLTPVGRAVIYRGLNNALRQAEAHAREMGSRAAKAREAEGIARDLLDNARENADNAVKLIRDAIDELKSKENVSAKKMLRTLNMIKSALKFRPTITGG